jgi:hypothetical protein
MLHLCIVNKHIEPTTIKGFSVFARINHRWVAGKMIAIQDGLKLAEFPNVDFSSANLYDKAGLNLLEYGKGISGWLRVLFENIPSDQIRQADYKTIAIDAFGKNHKIIHKHKVGSSGAPNYFPGAGITVN